MSDKLTKRTILSKIGRLYDPNGFIAPVIVSPSKIAYAEIMGFQIDLG